MRRLFERLQKSAGYTLIEVLIVLAVLSFGGGLLWVIVHFARKFW
jgi:prepilin-type N-terminal cleavage/methylation domain-containing protein